MVALWALLLEAQDSPAGVPRTFVEEKKEEMRKAREGDTHALDERDRRARLDDYKSNDRGGGRGGGRGRGRGRGRGGFEDDRGGRARDGGWGTRGGGPGVSSFLHSNIYHLTILPACSVLITVPPGLHLRDDLPLPMKDGVLALPRHVDIVHLPADRALLLLTLAPLVRHRPAVVVSVPHPGPFLVLHHLHGASGVHLLIPLLLVFVTVATEAEGTAVALRLDDDVYLPAQVDPFRAVEVALDRLHPAKWVGAGV